MENEITKAINSAANFNDLGQAFWGSGTTNAVYTYSWPLYCYHTHDNSTEKAYQVIRALMKAKLVKVDTLEKFFNLMDEIKKVI